MRDWRNFKGLCLAALISLALAAPALGAPAGNEYLPKVPKAAGEEVLRGNQGPGGTVLSPEVRGDGRGSTSSDQSSSGDASSSGATDAGTSGDGGVSPAGASTSPGAADTLLDPVVLLLIVGVGAAALSMTLRHRQAMSADPDGDGAASEHGSTPSTPDGEIVDREPGS